MTYIYERLGTTDGVTDCHCCGRSNLKMTVALKNTETSEIVFFGRECAAHALGWTTKKLDQKTREEARAQQKSMEERRQARKNAIANHPAVQAVQTKLNAFWEQTPRPSFAESKALRDELLVAQKIAETEIGQ